MSTYKGFSSVELTKPKRSLFDHSHENRLTTRMGRLTPVLIKETLPNDTWHGKSEIMMRLAPLLAPIMHRVNVFVHYFFVPNRLLWEDWEEFITNGQLGTETPPVPPNVKIGGVNSVLAQGMNLMITKSLSDYLGMDTFTDGLSATYADRTMDLMPFAAYYKCWYDYYRDRNYVLDNEVLPLASGTHSAADIFIKDILGVKTRHWQKDYYTSALPFTQRGDEVLMPLQGSGEVTYWLPSDVRRADNGALITGAARPLQVSTTGGVQVDEATGDINAYIDNINSVDITSSDVSINDLRLATSLQKFLERQALAGSRMNETIWAHFNRRTSDGRLQRAEYLGGAKVLVKVGEVLTTAFSQDDADETVPPGNMAGRGIVFDRTGGFHYNCEEWGFIIGIMSVMPNSAYMQGSDRMFLARNTFLDYPWPSFAHLGEQEVKDYELFTSTASLPVDRTAQPVFGYQSRYADWKYTRSQAHGDFKGSLDFWHLCREFASQPELGDVFCAFEDALQDRVFAVSGVDTLWCYIYNNLTVVRSLPYFGTPRL